MFYVELFRSLHQHGVDYLLVGGLAMNLHGVPRVTMDIDIALDMGDTNLDRFIACAAALGLKPQAPVPLSALKDPGQRRRWADEMNMVAFALNAADAHAPTLDVLIAPGLDWGQASARAVQRMVGEVPVRLAAVEDMITLKSVAGRRQDHDDLEHLRRIRGEP